MESFESAGVWQGREVVVRAEEECPGHELEVMHHTDEAGRHWCPTGFLWCPVCAGVAHEPKPYSCSRWGC